MNYLREHVATSDLFEYYESHQKPYWIGWWSHYPMRVDGDPLVVLVLIYVFDIVYFNFIGQLFSPHVIVVFDFRLSSFRLHLGQYLGLRLSLVGYVYFTIVFAYVAFRLVPHRKWVETYSQVKFI